MNKVNQIFILEKRILFKIDIFRDNNSVNGRNYNLIKKIQYCKYNKEIKFEI
jgi:hypothetical protein